jgi:hypothetical protein
MFDESFNAKTILITSGKVSKSSFTLLGIEQPNSLCPNDPTPSQVTITAQCVEGTTVTFTAANGETGTFPNSNVVCTSIRQSIYIFFDKYKSPTSFFF